MKNDDFGDLSTENLSNSCALSLLPNPSEETPLSTALSCDLVQEEIIHVISQYADDTNTIVTSERSINTTLKFFKVYGRASGAKINISKSVGLWLGPWKARKDSPFGFQWTACVKIYGTYFVENSVQKNANVILEKVKRTANLHRGRQLTLTAKARVVNTAMCSKLWYDGSCITFPPETIKEQETVIFKFIWSNQTELVSRKPSSTSRRTEGGLGIVDINSKLNSLICTHMKCMLTIFFRLLGRPSAASSESGHRLQSPTAR